jgi:hypothetical protein
MKSDNLCKCGHQAFLHINSQIPNVMHGTGPCARTECDCKAFKLPFQPLTVDMRHEISSLLIPIAKADIRTARSILRRANPGKLIGQSTVSTTPVESYESMKAECIAWHQREDARANRLRVLQFTVKVVEAEVRETKNIYEVAQCKLIDLKKEASRLLNRE